ncbi:MAG: class I SAM-dependent methyltransferase [Phycisphaerales bacterium]|nr:MAG: class I SAM-dependent methyltransferase [Phycisphaerales bacterium]
MRLDDPGRAGHHAGMNARSIFERALGRSAGALGFPLAPGHVELMWRHFELLLEANRRFNLTRITEPAEAAVRHYADSLALPAWVESMDESRPAEHSEFRVLDVGAGGGFPAVPAAIVRGDWVVTALDKTGKKARFVQRCAEELGLANLSGVHGRVPPWRPEYLMHLSVLRAVGSTKEALASVAEVVRPGGWVVCFKTATTPRSEVEEGRRWAEAHGWSGPKHFDYALHERERGSPRRLVLFRRGE